MDLTTLANPFNPEDIEFRAGATTKDKSKALALAYITSRAVMDRLDQAVGPANWKDEYTAGPDGGVLCGISIKTENGEWVTKYDGAENTNYESIKGGLSDSFKRAAVKWGIGRYLYTLPAPWVACKSYGKTVKIDEGEARRAVFGQQANRTTQQQDKVSISQPSPSKQTNGGKPKDAWTIFWETARARGLSDDEAKEIIKQANNNAVTSIDILNDG